MTTTTTTEPAPFVAGEELLASPSRAYTPRPAVVVSCVPHEKLLERGIILWLLTFRIVETGTEHTVQTKSRDYLAQTGPGSPAATVIAPVRQAAALSPAAQDVLDAFVPAPSLTDVLDPATEAKAAAQAVGVEVGLCNVVGDAFQAVWVVLGNTATAWPFIALVSADERRAWVVAADLAPKSRGVRVETHPLI